MKQSIFLLFILSSFKSYCQENTLLPPDSLIKANKVKKARMKSTSRKGNGSGINVYYYNENGDLTKHHTLSPISNDPIFITDYYFDSSGKRYASVLHGGEDYSYYHSDKSGFTMSWASRFADSITYYYEYNKQMQFSRIYRKYPAGELMYETLYTYNPLFVTNKSFNMLHQVTTETDKYYDSANNIVKAITKKYDDEKIISTFTQEYQNIYNTAGQLTEVNYRNDTCSCVSHYKYYSKGLIKSRSNVGCLWNKKFKYKYYKKP